MGKSKSHNELEVVSEKKNPVPTSGIFFLHLHFSNSKQLQLLTGCVNSLRLAVAENLHFAELLIGDAQNANVAKLGHK